MVFAGIGAASMARQCQHISKKKSTVFVPTAKQPPLARDAAACKPPPEGRRPKPETRKPQAASRKPQAASRFAQMSLISRLNSSTSSKLRYTEAKRT